MKNLVIISLLLGTAGAIAEPQSNHLRQFSIQQCNDEKACIHAKGQIGFWSKEGDSLSATDVVLEISKGTPSHSQVYFCRSFNYDLPSQFIICDNQKQNAISLTLSAKLELRKYRPLTSRIGAGL